jgi:hypothetical protein
MFLSDESSKTLKKKRFTKKSCRKVFTKESTEKFETDFFSIVLSRFWAFLGKGEFKNTIKNLPKKLTSPASFFAPEEPTAKVTNRVYSCAPAGVYSALCSS